MEVDHHHRSYTNNDNYIVRSDQDLDCSPVRYMHIDASCSDDGNGAVWCYFICVFFQSKRFSGGYPWTLLLARGSKSAQRWLLLLLIIITCLNSIVLQFLSTFLISDLAEGQISGDARTYWYPAQFSIFNTNSEPDWPFLSPSSFPIFAEHTEPSLPKEILMIPELVCEASFLSARPLSERVYITILAEEPYLTVELSVCVHRCGI